MSKFVFFAVILPWCTNNFYNNGNSKTVRPREDINYLVMDRIVYRLFHQVKNSSTLFWHDFDYDIQISKIVNLKRSLYLQTVINV